MQVLIRIRGNHIEHMFLKVTHSTARNQEHDKMYELVQLYVSNI